MDKDEIKRRRARSISAELGINADDRVMAMLSRQDGMYIVSLEKILQVSLPEELDPDADHPDAPIAQSAVLNIGSRNPIVARTVLQAQDFTQFLAQNEQKQKVNDIAWEVMHSLLALDRIVKWLKTTVQQLKEEISADLQKYTDGPSPFPLPIVDDLETQFRSAIFMGKHALNSISELFPTLFKGDFTRGRYDKIVTWSNATFGQKAPLARMLTADHQWIFLWTEVRNALEHPKAGYYVRINNFRLLASREPQLPTWQLKHPTLDNYRPQNMVDALPLFQENILTFFENLLLELVLRSRSHPIPIQVIDREVEGRDPDCPKRYMATIASVRRD